MPAIATFRDLISRLDSDHHLRRITRPVDPRFELIAVTRLVQKAGNEPLLFENVVGSGQPVASNILGRRQSLADALGHDAGSLVPWLMNQTGAMPPEVVNAAPVQEVVVTRDIDVGREIPQVVHSERDAGAYISAGVCISANPDDGVINASWNRIQIVGDNHARIRMMPPQHLGQYQALAEQRKAALPVAVAIGAPPSLMLSAASKIPYEADEYEAAGTWAGSPLRVTKGVTVPLLVPADAEMIIEGFVPPNVREEEGPFGEFTDAYAERAPNHVLHVTAVTRRKDAIYHVILAGGTEDRVLLGVPLQVEVYRRIVNLARIRDVATPGHIFGCVISLEKHSDAEVQAVLKAALEAHPWMKLVVVVDADVNPHDDEEVLWALHTRFRPDTGLLYLPGVPSFQRADVRAVHRGKMGFDATAPMEMQAVFKRRRFPGSENIRLSDYFSTDPAEKLRPE